VEDAEEPLIGLRRAVEREHSLRHFPAARPVLRTPKMGLARPEIRREQATHAPLERDGHLARKGALHAVPLRLASVRCQIPRDFAKMPVMRAALRPAALRAVASRLRRVCGTNNATVPSDFGSHGTGTRFQHASPAAAAAGKLFVCGWSKSGALGLGEVTKAAEPTLVPTEGSVVSVACGKKFTVFATEDGKVFAMGDNGKGELGAPSAGKTQASPVQVEALAGVKVVHVSAGLHHSLAVSDKGELFSWGWGGSTMPGSTVGALGHGYCAECRGKRYHMLITGERRGEGEYVRHGRRNLAQRV